MLARLLDSNVSIVDLKTVELNDFNEKEAAVTSAAPPTIWLNPVSVLISCPIVLVNAVAISVFFNDDSAFCAVVSHFVTVSKLYAQPFVTFTLVAALMLVSGPTNMPHLKPTWFEKEAPTVVEVDCPNVVENENPSKRLFDQPVCFELLLPT